MEVRRCRSCQLIGAQAARVECVRGVQREEDVETNVRARPRDGFTAIHSGLLRGPRLSASSKTLLHLDDDEREVVQVGHCDAGLGWGRSSTRSASWQKVGPGGADGVHVDVAPQHAGMLVELAEAVSPSIVGDACAHVRAARLPAGAVAAE